MVEKINPGREGYLLHRSVRALPHDKKISFVLSNLQPLGPDNTDYSHIARYLEILSIPGGVGIELHEKDAEQLLRRIFVLAADASTPEYLRVTALLLLSRVKRIAVSPTLAINHLKKDTQSTTYKNAYGYDVDFDTIREIMELNIAQTAVTIDQAVKPEPTLEMDFAFAN